MKDSYFRKEALIEALKKAIANISIQIDQGCKDPDNIKAYSEFYIAISLKAFYYFYLKGMNFTRCEMALKEYNLLYVDTFKDTISSISSSNVAEFLAPSMFDDVEPEDERFIILAMLNLSSFITSNNINKTKHIINTYIPKVRNCLKNMDKYPILFNTSKHTSMEIKTTLFKFLVENG